MSLVSIKRALISVSDKTNLVEFANELKAAGVEILSTGGTAKLLSEAGIPVVKINDYTGFPEIMGGRVKTLHPKVHGGLLGRLGTDEAVMQAQDIPTIDLLVVNLYPFSQTIAKVDCSYEDAIENIDIGGPAMLRAGAKNHERVSVLVDPSDYSQLSEELKAQQGSVSLATRKRLAAKVYAHTAQYDAQIANYLSKVNNESSVDADKKLLFMAYKEKTTLRYGENPHQSAAVYLPIGDETSGVASVNPLQGKALSYNNLVDADAAVNTVYEYDDLACVIVKHANPCGIAIGENLLEAYERAYQCDPTSAFGGIIAFNTNVNHTVAKEIISRQFVEVVVAPSFTSMALEVFAEKPNVRVLALGDNFSKPSKISLFKRVSGGLLVQSSDDIALAKENLQVVSRREPTADELHDLLFAWKAVKHVKSNAIVYAKNRMTLGIGCGQTSRVHSSLIGSIKAKEQNLDLNGAVLASDAFFPFRDGLDNAASVGVSAIIQPGGSMRDEEIITAANEHNMAMIFTGIRHFNH